PQSAWTFESHARTRQATSGVAVNDAAADGTGSDLSSLGVVARTDLRSSCADRQKKRQRQRQLAKDRDVRLQHVLSDRALARRSTEGAGGNVQVNPGHYRQPPIDVSMLGGNRQESKTKT